jgi:hypothetical protein
MSRKKPALGLDPRAGTGFAKKDMLKQKLSCRENDNVAQ